MKIEHGWGPLLDRKFIKCVCKSARSKGINVLDRRCREAGWKRKKRTLEVELEQQSTGLEKIAGVLTLFSGFSGKREPNLAVTPL